MSGPTEQSASEGTASAGADGRDVAAAWLERLQAGFYKALGLPDRLENPAKLSSPAAAAHLEQLAKATDSPADSPDDIAGRLASARALLPTPYESAVFYPLILGLAADIEGILRQNGRHLPPAPLFGTLPTGRLDGLAAVVPGTDRRVVLLERGLFGFANLMCKAIAMAFPERSSEAGVISLSANPEELRRTIGQKPEIAERFFSAVMAYVVEGNPHRAKPHMPSRAALNLAAPLRSAMELFALGHQYGHLVAGHLEPGAAPTIKLARIGVEMVAPSPQQELEADALALEVMLGVQMRQGYDLALCFWGTEAFFGCIDVLARTVSLLAHGEEPPSVADTHPPTAERRRRLAHLLPTLAKDDGGEAAAEALDLASIIAAIIDELWRTIRPAVLRLHAKGYRPASSWMSLG